MTLELLQNIWFILFFVLIIVYAILDGFDLGIGFWSLFERDRDRRGHYMDIIAPVWDGNEVWLLTAGGALFAAFPFVYATVFSGFYLAMMLLLAALMFRAVSFEFRNKVAAPKWQTAWDVAFGLGSLIPSLLYGVAVGNILRGLPVERDAAGFIWKGSFFDLLNPFALLIGAMTLAMFATHGALYVAHKANGDAGKRAVRYVLPAYFAWVILWVAGMATVPFVAPHLLEQASKSGLGWFFLVISVASLIAIPLFHRAARYGSGFVASSFAIASQTALAAKGLYPKLVPSLLDFAGASLTIHNASSSRLTLLVMLVIAAIGVPIVLAYTAFIYRTFKGKVRPGEFYGSH